jgi:hypothetical protein
MASVNTPNRHAVQTEAQLAEAVSLFYDDPYGFVMFAYPWGEAVLPDGSPGPLANKLGPEPWQRRLLQKLGNHIRNNIDLKSFGLDYQVARYARASGHGVGKSALVAWLIQFFMATRRDCRGAVTANTAAQLETRTWPELARWHRMFICKHWFVWTATSYYFGLYPPEQQKNYMFTAATVSEHNTDAFQGLHNEDGAVIVIFDEAGGLFPKLWEVAQGALTDGEPFFFAFGNPTDPDAEFANCFTRHENMYDIETIDSREVSFTNKSALDDMIRLWGEDSDEVRVRIKGQFPRNSYDGFIPADALLQAREREHEPDPEAAVIMAVDVARYGRDKTVIRVRHGRNARRPPVKLQGKNNVEVADAVQREIDIVKPDEVVIESTGPGAGVIDILRSRHYKITEVHPGSNSDKPQYYYRKRDEWWGKCRDWIINEGCLPNEIELIEQLSKMKYHMDRFNTSIKIESKEEYTERTKLTSPDEADSLVLTFASKVTRRDRALDVRYRPQMAEAISDYDIFIH